MDIAREFRRQLFNFQTARDQLSHELKRGDAGSALGERVTQVERLATAVSSAWDAAGAAIVAMEEQLAREAEFIEYARYAMVKNGPVVDDVLLRTLAWAEGTPAYDRLRELVARIAAPAAEPPPTRREHRPTNAGSNA
jgi:hypothetical protein